MANGDQALTPPPVAQAVEVIRQQATSADFVVLRLAVLGLILVALAVVVGTVFLINGGHQLPDGIIALGSAAVGSLATMMVRPPSRT